MKESMHQRTKRWSVRKKLEVVLRLLAGEPIDEVSRDVGVEISRLDDWRRTAMFGMETTFKERVNDPVANELMRAKQTIGELSMANELLKDRVKKKKPFSIKEVEVKAKETSPTSGKKYGIKRVCDSWNVPRSTLYHQRAMSKSCKAKKKPGPKPKVADEELLRLIKKTIETSSFKGEGYRKINARIRRKRDHAFSKNRILRYGRIYY